MSRRQGWGMALVLAGVCSGCAIQASDPAAVHAAKGESQEELLLLPGSGGFHAVHTSTPPPTLAELGISSLTLNGTAFATAIVTSPNYPTEFTVGTRNQWWVLEVYAEPSPTGVLYYQLLTSNQYNGLPDTIVGDPCNVPPASGGTCFGAGSTVVPYVPCPDGLCMMPSLPPTDMPAFVVQ